MKEKLTALNVNLRLQSQIKFFYVLCSLTQILWANLRIQWTLYKFIILDVILVSQNLLQMCAVLQFLIPEQY